MLCLLWCLGIDRVRVPDTTGFAQTIPQPLGWAHPGQGQSKGECGSTCPGAVAGSSGASWAGKQPGDLSFCLSACLSTNSPSALSLLPRAGGCSPALGSAWLHPWESHLAPSSPRLLRPSRTCLGKETGGALHHPGALPPPHPADTSPCTHLAGDVTWRLRRGENLLPAPVQR